jgi:hypothetical protein
MAEVLDYYWAKHIIEKYEYEYDAKIRSKYEMKCVLEKLMYEKDFECEEQDFEDILDKLMNEIENLSDSGSEMDSDSDNE